MTKTHSDFLADLLTVLPSPRASIWHTLQCGKVRRPSEMRKKIQKKPKKHGCLTEEGFEEEGEKKKKKSHFFDTLLAHVIPSEARRCWFMAAVARVWWKIYSCFASERRPFWGNQSYLGARSNCGARSHPGARNTSWVSGGLVFQKGQSDKTRSSCISRNFFLKHF